MMAAFVISLIAIVCFLEQRKRPAISVTQIIYRKLLGGRLMVDFEIANTGKTPIGAQAFDARAWLVNADAQVYMEIPFGAMLRDPIR